MRPTSISLLKAYWLIAVGLLLIALSAPLIGLSLTPPTALSSVVDYLADDAYYYLGIAANVASVGKSSLDGVTATNGYHPLWMLTLAGLAAIVGDHPWTFFIATIFLIATIAAASTLTAILWRTDLSSRVALATSTGLAITLLQFHETFLWGMEPILMAPLFVPLVVLLESKLTHRTIFTISGILAIFFLARIDSLVLFGATALMIIYLRLTQSRTTGQAAAIDMVGDLARLGAIIAPVVLAYLVVNQLLFLTPVPVSGLAKKLGGPNFANWGILNDFLSHPRFLIIPAIALPIVEITAWRKAIRSMQLYRSIMVFAIAAVAQAVYYAAFSTWPIWPWYTYLTALLSALLLARIIYLATVLLEIRQTRTLAIVILCLLTLFDLIKVQTYMGSAVRWIVTVSHPGTIPATPKEKLSYNQVTVEMLNTFFSDTHDSQVAMGDRAGALSFWGRPKFSLVQAEGLTLDAAYILARQHNAVEGYFNSKFDIQYWVVDRQYVPIVKGDDGSSEYVIADPIQGRVTIESVPVFCFPSSALVYRRAYGAASQRSVRYIFLYRKHQQCSDTALAIVNDALREQGLRQLSMPDEYNPAIGGQSNKAREDRDRRLAISHARAPS